MFGRSRGAPASGCHLNVEIGKHISHEELLEHYHGVIYAVGASSDRKLGIPGEDLRGSNCRPPSSSPGTTVIPTTSTPFDLTGGAGRHRRQRQRRARRRPHPRSPSRTCSPTPTSPSRAEGAAREQHRRGRDPGPAWTRTGRLHQPELLALGLMADVDIDVDPASSRVDSHSAAEVAQSPAKRAEVETCASVANRPFGTRSGSCSATCASPVEMRATTRDRGRVARNEMVDRPRRRVRASSTDETETARDSHRAPLGRLPRRAGRGSAVRRRRADDPERRRPGAHRARWRDRPGTYVTGWIKRGPTGVIGTNR